MLLQGPANVDAIGLLVELGASLWSVMKDADMETPLHMASRSGRLDIVEKLLRCGADFSKKTKVIGAAAGLYYWGWSLLLMHVLLSCRLLLGALPLLVITLCAVLKFVNVIPHPELYDRHNAHLVFLE